MPANGPARDTPVTELQEIAKSLRRRMLAMAAHKGEGYIAQGLGIADALAVVYFRELALDATVLDDPQRDRFILSTGHYSIAFYAVLAELSVLTDSDLDDYALNESRLPMSTFDETPGVEVTSGSLGQGLGQAVGMALGLRLDDSLARVMVELSDGEMQEGSTWEAAAAAASFRLDQLWALVDCNGIQADGRLVLGFEPVAAKWEAFGWSTTEVDGNDIKALVAGFDKLRNRPGPRAIIMRTTPGYGVPTLERRERAHFVRVGDDEWTQLVEELERHG